MNSNITNVKKFGRFAITSDVGCQTSNRLKTLVMRFWYTTLLLTSIFLQTSLAGVAQRVTLNATQVKLADLFQTIKKQTGYVVIHDSPELESLRADVHLTDATVQEALETVLLNKPYRFSIVDRNIFIRYDASRKTREPKQTAQQQRTVSGTVTSDTGEPLQAVTIRLSSGNTVGETDPQGNFRIQIGPDESLLQFSIVGYETQVIKLGQENTVRVTMPTLISNIEEVIVVGYGQQKKVNLTGAVESVGSEVFENRTTSNVTQALQGAVPNLNLSLEDGKPTRSSSFNVRGTTSIGQGGSALVLIDGVEGDPSFLNPNDIDQVTVLKDAASAAIYGARGSFGVVLITTKKPKKGRTTLNYTGSAGFQSLTQTPEFVTDGVTWLEHFRDSYYNRQRTVPTSINNNTQFYSDEWLERMREWKASGEGEKTVVLPNGNYEYYSNTDWMGMLFQDRVFTQDHNVSISGGNEKGDFFVSGRFYDFGGLYNFDPDTYRSYNLRAKGSLKAYDWLDISNNMEFSNNDYHMPYSALGRSANIQRYIEVSAFPTLPMYNPDGTYTRGGASTLGAFVDGNNYQDNTRNLFRNTVSANSHFFDNTFRVNADFTFRYDSRDFFYKRVKVPYYQNAETETPTYLGDINGTIYEWTSQTMYTASNLYAEYENTFADKHYLKAMVGWNYETSAYDASSISRNQLLLEGAESIQLATGSTITPGSSVTNWRIMGNFFRLNYVFQDRYLIEVNGRYDGSSRFPSDQQWGFFPSVSAGWRLSEEPFWHVDKSIFSDVKFRGSYGSLGNGNISAYQFLELLTVRSSPRVLDGRLGNRASAPNPIPDGLTWERATTTDLGLDFGMVNGKLRFTGDYYVRKTTDMYVEGPTLPDIFGAESPKGNYADMTTKGFEISIGWRDQFTVANKPFNYHLRGGLFDYVSEIDKFNNPTKRFTDHYDGQIIGELWGFETDGLFQSDPDPSEYINTIFNSSADAVWRAGDVKIRNRDGSPDNMITKGEQTVDNPGDMTIIGNTEPRYQYTFTLGADWNGIFFSAFFQGVGKQDWYPGSETAFWGQYNRGYNQIPAWHLGNYWTEDNRDAYLPRYSQYNGALGYTNYVPNDRYLQSVAYLRLRNLQVGYTLPLAWVSKAGFSNVRIFASGENLASWSPLYKRAKNFMDVASATAGSDSDLSESYVQGDGNSYPLLKTYTFGISLTY